MYPLMVSLFTVGWIGWLLFFFAEEAWALKKGHGATLSEHVWAWFGIAARKVPPTLWVRLRRIGLIGFLAWLAIHFLTGGTFV